MITFIWGLPGAGKSTVGKMVADQKGVTHLEMDDYLPLEFKNKMKSGELITDEDRDNFFTSFTEVLKKYGNTDMVVSGYVAKKRHRDQLRSIGNLSFFELVVREDVLRERLKKRGEHFFKEETLQKVLKNYEPLTDSKKIDASKNIEEVVAQIVEDGA